MVDFFQGLGFQLPPRKGVADFLQEITSRKEQKVQNPPSPPLPFPFPPGQQKRPSLHAAHRRMQDVPVTAVLIHELHCDGQCCRLDYRWC